MPQVTKLRDKRRIKKQMLTGKAVVLSPRTVEVVQLRYQVMELRRDGHTIRDIAQSLGESEASIREAIRVALKHTIEATSETTEEHRQLEIERYDSLLKVYTPMAINGNLAATAVILQISSMRRKLLALDIPEVKKLDVTGIREYIGIDMEKV